MCADITPKTIVLETNLQKKKKTVMMTTVHIVDKRIKIEVKSKETSADKKMTLHTLHLNPFLN